MTASGRFASIPRKASSSSATRSGRLLSQWPPPSSMYSTNGFERGSAALASATTRCRGSCDCISTLQGRSIINRVFQHRTGTPYRNCDSILCGTGSLKIGGIPIGADSVSSARPSSMRGSRPRRPPISSQWCRYSRILRHRVCMIFDLVTFFYAMDGLLLRRCWSRLTARRRLRAVGSEPLRTSLRAVGCSHSRYTGCEAVPRSGLSF